MTLYVDDYRAPIGQMVMSHMMADTTAELLAAADVLGLKREWLQKAGTEYEHFDVSDSKRWQSIISLGAVQIASKDLIRRVVWPKRAALSPVHHQPDGTSQPALIDADAIVAA